MWKYFMPNIEASSAFSIDIMTVINTDYVMKQYPNPSKDSTKPTGIDHSSEYMICTGSRGIISGQGTADLSFKANPGDNLAFRGIAVDGNSDSAVIIYGIQFGSGDHVFNQFVANLVARSGAIMPNVDSQNGLPAKTAPMNFTSLDSKVSKKGVEHFLVQFGLYTLAADGETQTLFGYYSWDPTITVS